MTIKIKTETNSLFQYTSFFLISCLSHFPHQHTVWPQFPVTTHFPHISLPPTNALCSFYFKSRQNLLLINHYPKCAPLMHFLNFPVLCVFFFFFFALNVKIRLLGLKSELVKTFWLKLVDILLRRDGLNSPN